MHWLTGCQRGSQPVYGSWFHGNYRNVNGRGIRADLVKELRIASRDNGFRWKYRGGQIEEGSAARCYITLKAFNSIAPEVDHPGQRIVLAIQEYG